MRRDRRPALRGVRGRVLCPVLLVGILALVSAHGAEGGPAPTPPAPGRVGSVMDSPGYVPLVDPESSSVVIGRRTSAPRVSKPFKGGARSLDELGRAVCRALHRSDPESLLALCIREDEFRDILWREFPQSRPVTGLTWEDGWRTLLVRLNAGCVEAIRDHGGHHYEFLGFEVDSTMVYKNFKLHSRLILVARDDEGRTRRMTWLRAIAERKGFFKIYSTTD